MVWVEFATEVRHLRVLHSQNSLLNTSLQSARWSQQVNKGPACVGAGLVYVNLQFQCPVYLEVVLWPLSVTANISKRKVLGWEDSLMVIQKDFHS